MTYDFGNLSYADFEDLVRDLLGRELGVRFEAFGPGPDGGIDGRHAASSDKTILQAKHYLKSSFSALKSTMIKERVSIDKLQPTRYLLATSKSISPANKAELAEIIGQSLKSQADIFSPSDLNGLLRKYPDVERANIKLWLSSAAVLDRVVNAATHTFTAITRADIEAKLNVYAQNPSFQEAKDKLEAEHVVIIAGPPGVGKTTLAEMLSYSFIAEGWEYIAIRSIDEGLTALTDSKKQIFFFDDFLGKAALDAHALSSSDSSLARFIKRVRGSRNARFVLTTRAPIFEEARRVSEHLADPGLDVTKYLLDVGAYTRRIKARILYNHLVMSGISKDHIQSLWDSGSIREIVDHKNYNPRIISAMTDRVHLRDVESHEYPSRFIEALNNPNQIWDVAFRKHIPAICRHLLYALFFCSEYGASIDELRIAFNALHTYMSNKYSIPHDPKDFEESLRILEGGFIYIRDRHVSFVNPSVRDYLIWYLDNAEMLADFAATAQKVSWGLRLWEHVRNVKEMSSAEQMVVARNFIALAERLIHLPVFRRSSNSYLSMDLGNAARISLLLEWHDVTKDERLVDIAASLIANPIEGFTAWTDAQRLIEIVQELQDGTLKPFKKADEVRASLEDKIISILDGHVWPDDLETIDDAIQAADPYLGAEVKAARDRAILREVKEIDAMIADVESESTLVDHISALRRFGPRVGITGKPLEQAIESIDLRIKEIQESTEEAEPPQLSSRPIRERDKFDDADLANLFAPLLQEHDGRVLGIQTDAK